MSQVSVRNCDTLSSANTLGFVKQFSGEEDPRVDPWGTACFDVPKVLETILSCIRF
jgi:hypothetical protein